MSGLIEPELHRRRYRDAFGAEFRPCFDDWVQQPGRAGLGYRRAEAGKLYLEHYLDRPVEQIVGEAFDRPVLRSAIVEIGNFAAEGALSMVHLWGLAANDLGHSSELAVATLTAPLRRIFRRMEVPIVELVPALPQRLGRCATQWGSYYSQDPVVCVGEIAAGQAALARFGRPGTEVLS